MSHLKCPLAVAARGMRDDAGARLERIGVRFDATPESEAALSLAGSIALAAGADLHVRGVVDDRVAGQLVSLSERARAAALDTGARAHVDVVPGAPADGLRELCDHVDLLVIGSGHGERRVECSWEAPAGDFWATRPRQS